MFFTKTTLIAVFSVYSVVIQAAPVLQARVVSRTTAPTGALIVRQNGAQPGEYANISAAVIALGNTKTAKTIFIYPGTYSEQVTLEYNGPLTIYGYTSNSSNYANNQVVITQSIASANTGSLDTSATVRAHRASLSMYNVNMTNTYGVGSPALAIIAGEDKQAYYGCAFVSRQDTMLASKNRQYYSKCYIEGATDYIFGSASAWFEQCTMASSAAGYITAMGRSDNTSAAWYVINNSLITSTSSFTNAKAQVYLGRPWKIFARVIYQYSTLTNVINPKGWTTMAAGAQPTFEEYQNKGDGSNTSGRLYETKATGPVKITDLLGSDYNTWVDTTY